MNLVTLHTHELRMLQTLVANRIADLDRFIADPTNYTKHGEMAGAVRQADVRYRVDLHNMYVTLDSLNPI